jgi:hypothetical protein
MKRYGEGFRPTFTGLLIEVGTAQAPSPYRAGHNL